MEETNRINYRTSHKTATGDCTEEIKTRIAITQVTQQKTTELTNVWKDRNVSKALKVRVSPLYGRSVTMTVIN